MSEDTKTDTGGWFVWLLTGAALIAIGVAAFLWLRASEASPSSGPPEERGALVRVAEVSAIETLEIVQTGFVRERFAIDIAAEVGGRIETVDPRFRVGALVSKGTPLVTLRQDRFRADLMQAEASVEQAEAALAQAKSNYERQSELAANDFASEARLEEARTAREQAEAQLALAEANLVSAEIALDDSVVAAPYDAKILARTASPGQIVQPGTPFGRLVSADAVEISLGLAPADIRLLGDLQSVLDREVDIASPDAPDQILAEGVVTALDPRVAQGTRTTDILIQIDAPFEGRPRDLLLNELVNVAIPVDVPDGALSVPSLAVKAGDRVWEVGAEIRLIAHDVTVLRRLGDRTAFVSEGLTQDARVLITDLPAPVEGQAVRVRAADGSSGDAGQ